MKRTAEELDLRLWKIVTSTVRPLHPVRQISGAAPATLPPKIAKAPAAKPATTMLRRQGTPGKKPAVRQPMGIDAIEPGRRRRLDRGRDQPAGALDLHGLTQDEARASLSRFVLRAVAEQRRTVLVITGKGALGDGVLRRRVPEWLGEAPLRQVVAGISEAHRRHGGEGALYVALKRVAAG